MRNYNKLPYTYEGADACWEENIISLGQVIPCFFMDPKIHSRLHKNPSIIPILNSISPIYIQTLTHSMEQSPSWEVNRFSASQEIPRILWKPKVHYRI